MFVVPLLLLLLLPFLWWAERYPVSDPVQLGISVLLLAMAIPGGIRLRQKLYDAPNEQQLRATLHQGQVESTLYQIKRVIHRGDPEDFGEEYYLELEREQGVLFLQEQDIFSDQFPFYFPSTTLEVSYIPGTDTLLVVFVRGEALSPERSFPALSKQEWRKRPLLISGKVYAQTIEELLAGR